MSTELSERAARPDPSMTAYCLLTRVSAREEETCQLDHRRPLGIGPSIWGDRHTRVWSTWMRFFVSTASDTERSLAVCCQSGILSAIRCF